MHVCDVFSVSVAQLGLIWDDKMSTISNIIDHGQTPNNKRTRAYFLQDVQQCSMSYSWEIQHSGSGTNAGIKDPECNEAIGYISAELWQRSSLAS